MQRRRRWRRRQESKRPFKPFKMFKPEFTPTFILPACAGEERLG